MAGNVDERVESWYRGNYAGVWMDRDGGPGPKDPVRVIRGGSWAGTPEDAAVFSRSADSVWVSHANVGFRIAR